MAAEREKKKVFTLTGSEEVHSQKALCVLTFITKGWVSLRGANSTNGLFYDRAAQIKESVCSAFVTKEDLRCWL